MTISWKRNFDEANVYRYIYIYYIYMSIIRYRYIIIYIYRCTYIIYIYIHMLIYVCVCAYNSNFIHTPFICSTHVGQVTCGGHTAKTCRACPQGLGKSNDELQSRFILLRLHLERLIQFIGHGASWCNRDCGWATLTRFNMWSAKCLKLVCQVDGTCKALFKTDKVTSDQAA